MKTNIKLLEDKIMEVAERLRTLKRERDALRGEVDGLRTKLRDPQRSAQRFAPGSPERERLDEVETALREAIGQLRGE
jgi:uncharacterized coiled-coil DUF342 family protein